MEKLTCSITCSSGCPDFSCSSERPSSVLHTSDKLFSLTSQPRGLITCVCATITCKRYLNLIDCQYVCTWGKKIQNENIFSFTKLFI